MSRAKDSTVPSLLRTARKAFEKEDYAASQKSYDSLFTATCGALTRADHRRYAYCLIESHDYSRALRTILAWERLDTKDPVLYSMKGYVLKQLHRPADARRALKRSLILKPRPSGYCMLGHLLVDLRELDRAADAFRAALALDETYSEARESLERIGEATRS